MSITEIEEEIKTLEASDTNYYNVQKLAWLYVVHDHMGGDNRSRETMPECGGEFGSIISGKSVEQVVSVLCEHMAVVKILYPKEYEAVCERLK